MIAIRVEERKLARASGELRALVRILGKERADKFAIRLAQLRAAETLDDLRHMPGRWHELTGDRAGQFAAHLDGPYRMVFIPDNGQRLENGAFDWASITAITIVAIIDYHER